MPLPDPNIAWPPRPLARITPVLREWAAWYAGDPAELASFYQGTDAPRNRPSQYRGGIIGAIARGFWGNPLPANAESHRSHVPIAADLARTGADLMFSDPPTFGVGDGSAGTTATLDRLNKIAEDGLYSTLAEASEIGGALGGYYLRVAWDAAVSPAPFLAIVDADAAWPDFTGPWLTGVTFWWVVEQHDSTVLRHIERHELDGNGDGWIVHALYKGTPTNLGSPVDLAGHPSTAVYATDPAWNGEGAYNTGPGLCVEYVPNQRPAAVWRGDPIGAQLGRSDYAGVEKLMGDLDETMTSWQRDIRLAKARLLVPEFMFDSVGAGAGGVVNLDREVYEMLNVPASAAVAPQLIQAAIRFAEHKATADYRTELIIRTAGYSAGSFGSDDDGAAITATEANLKNTRSMTTRDRKLRLAKPRHARILGKLLQVDGRVFGARNVPDVVSIDYAAGVQEAQLVLAQTALALRQAEAASTDTLVRLVHPDWAELDILAEVARIDARQVMADPTAFGGPGTETPDPADPAEDPDADPFPADE